MKKRAICHTVLLTACCVVAGVPSASADWPTYRADAASWCTCSYLNQATCALQPVE